MRIVNHTAYESKQLRAMIKYVADQELDPAQRKFITVHVHYRHQKGNRADRQGRRVQGKLGAGLRYNSFCVELPKDPVRANRETWRAYFGVRLAHEMAECRGRRHKEMRHPRYGYKLRGSKLPYGYPWNRALAVENYPLAKKVKQMASPSQAAGAKQKALAKKLLQAQARVLAWERKAKLAQTKLRVWRGTALRLGKRLDAQRADALAAPSAQPSVLAATAPVRTFLPFED